jgi:GTP-binding protein
MRREGYELQVAKPRVILKEVDGRTMEPVEEVMIDVPDDYVGAVIQAMGDRKGEMVDMKNMHNGTTRLQFICYSRALIGFTTEFITMTKGYGIYNHTYLEYRDILNAEIKSRYQGVLVSIDSGKTTPYSMIKLEDRGTMIVEPGTEVYEGMIIGINNKLGDLDVNVTKAKEQTNVRSANKDQTVSIKRPKLMSLEQYIEFLEDDELLEVTPESIRLRKRFLNKNERAKAMRELKFKA